MTRGNRGARGGSQIGYCVMEADAGPWPGSITRSAASANVPWYRSRAAWRFVFVRFVPLLAAGNLVWETLHLPFYTLWDAASVRSRAFAVIHCTIGDVMIGTAALIVSVMLFGRQGWPYLRHAPVLCATTLAGIGYTVFSEWVNTQFTMTWQYAESMPRVPPLGTGVTPLLQWMIVPPAAYLLTRATERARSTRTEV